MTGATLDSRLIGGRAATCVHDYTAAWSHDEIEVRLAGMADFADCPSLLNKTRGALGCVLLASASEAVRDRRPCNWTRPCAAEVFFGARPLVRVGDHDSEIAKPFVLAAEAVGADLAIRLRVFGLARDWSGTVAEALVAALRDEVRWHLLARDLARPAPCVTVIEGVRLATLIGLPPPTAAPATAEIAFRTPISAARGDPGRDAGLLSAAMARRLALMAPWHQVSAAAIHPALVAALAFVERATPVRRQDHEQKSTLAGHRYLNRTSAPARLALAGPSVATVTALRMSELTHVGRGASLGLGSFVLTLSIAEPKSTPEPLLHLSHKGGISRLESW